VKSFLFYNLYSLPFFFQNQDHAKPIREMVTYYLCTHAENQIVIPEIKLITSRHVSIYIHLFFIFSFSNVFDTSFFHSFIFIMCFAYFFLRVLNLLVMSQGNTNNRNFHFYSNELMYSIFLLSTYQHITVNYVYKFPNKTFSF